MVRISLDILAQGKWEGQVQPDLTWSISDGEEMEGERAREGMPVQVGGCWLSSRIGEWEREGRKVGGASNKREEGRKDFWLEIGREGCGWGAALASREDGEERHIPRGAQCGCCQWMEGKLQVEKGKDDYLLNINSHSNIKNIINALYVTYFTISYMGLDQTRLWWTWAWPDFLSGLKV